MARIRYCGGPHAERRWVTRSQLSCGVRPGELRNGFLSIQAASPPSRLPWKGEVARAPARVAGIGPPDDRDLESTLRCRATRCAGIAAPRPAFRVTVRQGRHQVRPASYRIPVLTRIATDGRAKHPCGARGRYRDRARVSPRCVCSPAAECWALGSSPYYAMRDATKTELVA